jgi:hypothetical protein
MLQFPFHTTIDHTAHLILVQQLLPLQVVWVAVHSRLGCFGTSPKSTFDAAVGHWSHLNDRWSKIQANDAWDVSWEVKQLSQEERQENIPVTKSKYKIYFNDLDGDCWYQSVPKSTSCIEEVWSDSSFWNSAKPFYFLNIVFLFKWDFY